MIITRKFKTIRFEPKYTNMQSRTRSGYVTTVFVGEPYWTAEYKLEGLRDTEFQERSAEIYAAGRDGRTLLCWDTFTRSVSLTGTASSVEQNSVTLTGLQVGVTIPKGAKISDENNVLCMVAEAVKVGLDTSANVKLLCLPSHYSFSGGVKIGGDARCAMMINPNSIQYRRGPSFNSISFTAQQVFT